MEKIDIHRLSIYGVITGLCLSQLYTLTPQGKADLEKAHAQRTFIQRSVKSFPEQAYLKFRNPWDNIPYEIKVPYSLDKQKLEDALR